MVVDLMMECNGNKKITKVAYEFKRMLIFKNGYNCSKELKKGEVKIKLEKQKTKETFKCNLPVALALSHQSNLVTLKYIVEFKLYSGNALLDTHEHDFYIEPNVSQEKCVEKIDENDDEDKD